jgi:hypothetical protein
MITRIVSVIWHGPFLGGTLLLETSCLAMSLLDIMLEGLSLHARLPRPSLWLLLRAITCDLPRTRNNNNKSHVLEEIKLSCAQLYTVTLQIICLLLIPTHIHHILDVIWLPTHIHHILDVIRLTMLIF